MEHGIVARSTMPYLQPSPSGYMIYIYTLYSNDGFLWRRLYRKGVSIVLDSYRIPLLPSSSSKKRKEKKRERGEGEGRNGGESFEQSYATPRQDLVGNLRPAAREIGFVRFSLRRFSRPLNEIAQSLASHRPHHTPLLLSFVTARRIVSRHLSILHSPFPSPVRVSLS